MSTQYSRYSKWVWTIGLMGVSAAALAEDVQPKPRPPQEPAGVVAGAVIESDRILASNASRSHGQHG